MVQFLRDEKAAAALVRFPNCNVQPSRTCNVRLTSIVLKNSEFERPREFRFRARRVISTDSPNGRAYGRVARGKTDRSAEPLRKTPSRLPAGF